MATLLRGFQISSNQISASHLTENAVVTAKIADANITTAKIADANVTTGKLADASVESEKIASGAVTAVKLAADSVTTAKILDLAVTTEKIAANAITSAKIGTGAVTEAKIGASAVTASKLGDNAVTTSKILDANITSAKLATSAVTNAAIAADAVDSSKIADDAIAAEHIADGAVGTLALASGAITYDKLDAAVQSKLDNTLSRVLDASTDPTNDTSGANWIAGTGAQVGSLWINTTTDEAFRCADATPNAEVWIKTSLTSDELGDLAFINQSTLEGSIQIAAVSQVTGLQAALDLKATDADVVKLTGNQTIAGVKTFSNGISGDLTGNVTGQVSDVQNHITTIALGEDNKFIDGQELAAKFTSIDSDISLKADDNAVVHLAGVETITGTKTFSATVSLGAGFEMGVSTITSVIETGVRANGVANQTSIATEAAIRISLDSLNTTLTAAINTKAADNTVVKLTGDQTIAGRKTFSTAPDFTNGFTVASGTTITSIATSVRASGSATDSVLATEAGVRAAIDAATAQVALSVRKEYTGDGTTNSFTFDQEGGTTSQLLVYRNGQLLRTTDDYTSNGSSISFGLAPETGEHIDILRWYTGN